MITLSTAISNDYVDTTELRKKRPEPFAYVAKSDHKVIHESNQHYHA